MNRVAKRNNRSKTKTAPKAIKVNPNQPFRIGAAYLIRTATMAVVGRVIAVGSQEVVVEDAAWVADTGRFADALRTGKFSEVEPFPAGPVIVGRGAIIDATMGNFTLPYAQA